MSHQTGQHHDETSTMTVLNASANKVNVSLWWALGIAIAAFLLRLSLTNFPTYSHMDEPIVAAQMQRYVDQGVLTANWDGFDFWWSRPTYQFSPYSLVESVIAALSHRLTGSPSNADECIRFARVCSCVWGTTAVLLVFFLGRTCFSDGAALWGEAILATCLVNVQDSIYARVDTFLCLLVMLSLVLAVRAVRRPGSHFWLVATCLSVGVTLAAKYNAVPVLLLIPLVPFRWAHTRAISWRRAAFLTIAGLLVAGAGFVAATPDVLRHPGPLIAGLRFEMNHYRAGQIPDQAYGWADNNLFYWTQYLAWLGLGLLPSLFAVLFVARAAIIRRWENLALAVFVVTGAVLTFATKVRFERNLEICLGPIALAAGVAAWECFLWIKRRPNAALARVAAAAFVALWFVQPARVLYHFAQTVDYPRVVKARLDHHPAGVGRRIYVSTLDIFTMKQSPESVVAGFDQVYLADYGDPFSAEAVRQWEKVLGREPSDTWVSPWSTHGYPFSTVDVYHGPARLYVFNMSTPDSAVPARK
jgi:4-amino-4-deoxy-L-arabinose transferase-like glycosyltransferase